ncbi:MAG: hypothetical protein KUG76_04925, partial [Gammaproteobacteria bacterium]|nr:hypothetical protein [Gammaproteobacteria bacterium]
CGVSPCESRSLSGFKLRTPVPKGAGVFLWAGETAFYLWGSSAVQPAKQLPALRHTDCCAIKACGFTPK